MSLLVSNGTTRANNKNRQYVKYPIRTGNSIS